MSTADTRRRARTELARAARAHLAGLGLRMPGSTPRQWLGDREWWVVNVEFQASRSANTAMLNVGVQHLWTVFPGRSFTFMSKVPSVAADFNGTDDAVREEADRIAVAARDAVMEWDARLGDRSRHLRWLASGVEDGPVPRLETAMARAVLGDADAARRTLMQISDAMDSDIDWQREQAAEARGLAALVVDDVAFRAELDQRVAQMRRDLGLDPLPAPLFS